MEQKEKSFPEELDDLIKAFKADPCERSYDRFLFHVLDGIAENVSIPVPADMDVERMTVKPRYYRHGDGTTSLVALSIPDGEKYPCFADVKLRAAVGIVLDDENCRGILLNPGEENEMLIRRQLLVGIIAAGAGMLGVDNNCAEKAADERYRSIRRPIGEEDFAQIKEKICSFRDDPEDYLVLDLIEDRDMLFMQACRSENLCHIELAFDMAGFGWEHPLILGNDMRLGEALDLLRRLCVGGESPDDIEEIRSGFHDIGFGRE